MLGIWRWRSSVPAFEELMAGGRTTCKQKVTRRWLTMTEDLEKSGQADSCSGARQTRVQILVLPYTRPWPSVFLSVSLGLLVCYMELTVLPNLGLLMKIQWNDAVECLSWCVTESWCLQTAHMLSVVLREHREAPLWLFSLGSSVVVMVLVGWWRWWPWCPRNQLWSHKLLKDS